MSVKWVGYKLEFPIQTILFILTVFCKFSRIERFFVNLNSDQLRIDYEEKEAEMKSQFEAKLEEIKRKSADDLNNSKAEMIAKLKRQYGKNLSWQQYENTKFVHLHKFYFHNIEANYEKFKADKEDEQQDLQRNYKRKLADADVRLR